MRRRSEAAMDERVSESSDRLPQVAGQCQFAPPEALQNETQSIRLAAVEGSDSLTLS
jgi:hypothetical protein